MEGWDQEDSGQKFEEWSCCGEVQRVIVPD
jgi:hypothetical protein